MLDHSNLMRNQLVTHENRYTIPIDLILKKKSQLPGGRRKVRMGLEVSEETPIIIGQAGISFPTSMPR